MDTFLYAIRSFDGPLYYITAILCVIFIMAIIGFLMERSLKEEEKAALERAGAFTVDLTTEKQESEAESAEKLMQPTTPGIIDFTESVQKREVQEELTTSPSPLEVEVAPVATDESIPEIK